MTDRDSLTLPQDSSPERISGAAGTILSTGLAVGLAGDLLLRGDGPGLNLLLLFLTLALAIRTVGRRAHPSWSLEADLWLAVGVLFAAGIAVRAAPPLTLLGFLCAAAALAFPALRSGAAWMRGSGVSDHVEAIVGAALYSGLGAVRLATEAFGFGSASPRPDPDDGAARRGTAAVLRGLLLAAPLLVVFGALFMSADQVFARLVTDVVGATLEDIASHVAVTAVIGWLAAGYLTGVAAGTRLRDVLGTGGRRPSVGIVEAGIALGLVDLLFALFVAVQFRYLFGGAEMVEVTPGLTYAEYAREGFAQLAVASALVLPSLLAADWLLRRERPGHDRVFRVLGGLQLFLLVLVVASAFQRVRVYQDAFGATESRLYGTVFLGWLVLSTAWFAATVLRGRRRHFAFPALASAFAVAAGLLIADPDAHIARTNLARAGVVTGQGSGAPPAAEAARAGSLPLDAEYLTSLSADAVPTLLGALPRLSADARCTVARRLLERWGSDRDVDWRSWNLAVARARRQVAGAAARLESIVGPGSGCPEDS